MKTPSDDRLAKEQERCPVRSVLSEIGDKWSLLVISELMSGSRRFSELQRAIPDISQRMLTKTLQKHQRSGFILRTVTPSTPPRVDYQLTELGVSFAQQVLLLSEWALKNMKAVKHAREAFDQTAC